MFLESKSFLKTIDQLCTWCDDVGGLWVVVGGTNYANFEWQVYVEKGMGSVSDLGAKCKENECAVQANHCKSVVFFPNYPKLMLLRLGLKPCDTVQWCVHSVHLYSSQLYNFQTSEYKTRVLSVIGIWVTECHQLFLIKTNSSNLQNLKSLKEY